MIAINEIEAPELKKSSIKALEIYNNGESSRLDKNTVQEVRKYIEDKNIEKAIVFVSHSCGAPSVIFSDKKLKETSATIDIDPTDFISDDIYTHSSGVVGIKAERMFFAPVTYETLRKKLNKKERQFYMDTLTSTLKEENPYFLPYVIFNLSVRDHRRRRIHRELKRTKEMIITTEEKLKEEFEAYEELRSGLNDEDIPLKFEKAKGIMNNLVEFKVDGDKLIAVTRPINILFQNLLWPMGQYKIFIDDDGVRVEGKHPHVYEQSYRPCFGANNNYMTNLLRRHDYIEVLAQVILMLHTYNSGNGYTMIENIVPRELAVAETCWCEKGEKTDDDCFICENICHHKMDMYERCRKETKNCTHCENFLCPFVGAE